MTVRTASMTNTRVGMGALAGALLAIAGNVLVYIAAGASGIPVVAPMPPDNVVSAIPLVMVILASSVPAFAAGALLSVLQRFTNNGRRLFLVLAVGFLLFSYMPLIVAMPPAVGAASRLALAVMHTVAGVSIISAVLRFSRMSS